MRLKDPREQDPEQSPHWAEGLHRHEAIRALLERRDGRLRAADVRDVATELGVSQATLYRLIAAYRAHGTVEALMPRTAGRPAGLRLIDRCTEDIIARCIREVYLTPNKLPLQRLVDEVHARCAQAELPAPHQRTIRARVLAIPDRTRALRRADTKAIKAATPVPGELVATRPLEIVQIDHTKMDVVIVDEKTRKPLPDRPRLTLANDVYSRMKPYQAGGQASKRRPLSRDG